MIDNIKACEEDERGHLRWGNSMCTAVNWIQLRNVCVFIGEITENAKGPTKKEK